MDGETKRELLCTTAEAVALLRRTSRMKQRYMLRVRGDAPVVDKLGHAFPHGLAHYLGLSQNQAVDLARNLLSAVLEERGGRIRIDVIESTSGTRRYRYFWIGG